MTNTTYIIKGRTYPVKDKLKQDYGAQWNRDLKAWIVVGSLSYRSLQDIRNLGDKIWIVTK